MGTQGEAWLTRGPPLAQIVTLAVEHVHPALAHLVFHGQRVGGPVFDVPGKEVDGALVVDGNARPHLEAHVGRVVWPVLDPLVATARIGAFSVVADVVRYAHGSFPPKLPAQRVQEISKIGMPDRVPRPVMRRGGRFETFPC